MNDTTFQGDGKVAYVPVMVNAKPKPMTNADLIRAMTDEELMEFLGHDYWSVDYCKKDAPIDQETKECLLPSCKQCWLEWLKQEADG